LPDAPEGQGRKRRLAAGDRQPQLPRRTFVGRLTGQQRHLIFRRLIQRLAGRLPERFQVPFQFWAIPCPPPAGRLSMGIGHHFVQVHIPAWRLQKAETARRRFPGPLAARRVAARDGIPGSRRGAPLLFAASKLKIGEGDDTAAGRIVRRVRPVGDPLSNDLNRLRTLLS